LNLHSETVAAFHRLYYESSNTTWKDTYWLGVRVAKCPLDLWIYQEILVETRPDIVIECGTAWGGSALFLASILDMVRNGRVVTVDVTEEARRPDHPRITYLPGSSTDPDVVERITSEIGADDSVMVILDSDHRAPHVRRELELYSPLVSPRCYLVIEDTNLNGHPVLGEFGPGPAEAVRDFLASDPPFAIDRSREKLLMTFNPGGYLRRT
jgi:cephalosporin hydroxylase